MRSLLPRGGSLPADEWDRRHRALLLILWLNAIVLPLYGQLSGEYNVVHTIEHTAPLVLLAVAATSRRFSSRMRSVFSSLGLLTAAAVLVHLTGGLIESHFYFFVVIVALTLYESWLPFLLAVAYVLFHHGVLGTVDPHQVYNRPEAWADPWTWAGIHAVFVGMAGVAGVVAWRLNEDVRERMQAAREEMAALSKTDSLTELGNRRRAMADLDRCFGAEAPESSVLVLFDLDGFKSYNDAFGHPAGDALLTRLGRRLEAAVEGAASAYRLGGDEFCVIGEGSTGERAKLEAIAGAALVERGQAFSVAASFGSVLIPDEAATPADAMRLADQRMYASKHSSRASAMRQSKDVLLQALNERHPEIGGHLDQVRDLVEPIAARLRLPEPRVAALCHAAELHDIGKVAIPDAILEKPGPLTDDEWEFIRRHTVIGQRIVAAAPVLAGVGEIIRSSHERWDGNGYPDGLRAEEIPLEARIIAVCDAYDAMVEDRPYRRGRSDADALAELERCAGSQFDPAVVRAFVACAESEEGLSRTPGGPFALRPEIVRAASNARPA